MLELEKTISHPKQLQHVAHQSEFALLVAMQAQERKDSSQWQVTYCCQTNNVGKEHLMHLCKSHLRHTEGTVIFLKTFPNGLKLLNWAVLYDWETGK